MRRLNLVGVGPGSCEYLTKQAYDLIAKSNEVYAFTRIKDLLNELNSKINIVKLSELIDVIKESKNKEITILLSGDINFYSATKYLQRNLDEGFEYNLVPGLTSFQILCSKINIPYEKMKLVSLHGQNSYYLGSIMSNRYTFLLCDKINNVTKILQDLSPHKHIKVYIGEDLGMPSECITIGRIDEIVLKNFSVLSVVIVENTRPIDLHETLYDSDYIRAKVPMTKQETRWLVVPMLDIKATDIVYDVGAGSGSVSVAMARKAHEGHVFALEKKEDAYQLIQENAAKLRAFNISTHLGSALDLIDDLPAPNKVFIGGSGRDLPKIVKKILAKTSEVTFVVTCITLETQSETMHLFKELDIEFDVVNINSARSKKVANYNMMYANNPITIIKGVYSDESQ